MDLVSIVMTSMDLVSMVRTSMNHIYRSCFQEHCVYSSEIPIIFELQMLP